MVHGILSDSRAWDPLVGLLERDVDVAEHIRIVRVDYPTKLFELNPKKSLPDLEPSPGIWVPSSPNSSPRTNPSFSRRTVRAGSSCSGIWRSSCTRVTVSSYAECVGY